MTAIGKVIRTTAFKLSAIYIAVFAVLTVFLIGYLSYNTTRLMTLNMHDRIDAEIRVLAAQYRNNGTAGLVQMVDQRSRRPGASLYLVTDFAGNVLAGNIASIERDVFDDPDGRARPAGYRRLDAEDQLVTEQAVVRVFRLRSGFRLLVGRDVGERERFRRIVGRAALIAGGTMVLLGFISWAFVSRRVLKRIDSMADTSRQIMAGDLSGRLQVTGTGDEFDRLADSLNAMLTRIERLMSGIKHVSDNIAHDLKTPLTRMRNRLEAVQRGPDSLDDYKDTLTRTLDEADQLIRTFNALLMISRIEAGTSGAAFDAIDVSAIVEDLCELYQPVAEEAEIAFTCRTEAVPKMQGNRELIGQAMANVIENALKYCVVAEREEGPRIDVRVTGGDEGILCIVSDNGPGIPEADRERVLERFVRLDASRSESGSGLGLSLVDAVVQMHNGRLELMDNAPGLKAILTLPVEQERGGEP